ncbi:MAG: hypothetical protein IJL32_16220 [Oscillospiraceae bacterium]|nr:hypothetical protein [Oscillospiraceae bacterium]
MNKRAKKAAFLAAFCYLALLGLGFGMLKTAQQTRKMLYGGKPVMAQLSHYENAANQTDYTVMLGGGEWKLRFSLPESGLAEQTAAQLPPCSLKLLLRLINYADRAACYTAEWISGR